MILTNAPKTNETNEAYLGWYLAFRDMLPTEIAPDIPPALELYPFVLGDVYLLLFLSRILSVIFDAHYCDDKILWDFLVVNI